MAGVVVVINELNQKNAQMTLRLLQMSSLMPKQNRQPETGAVVMVQDIGIPRKSNRTPLSHARNEGRNRTASHSRT
jgi:hypothetical protein